ncbi:hypothetical protein [Agrococcus casei]|uniref:Uncharacterized protein n=1 Tax=Agrococcus casei LMG 22410 TaxID=1255656 RepID=A0A1R4G1D1_9MICO|nr:hypothetical protein [Agrococcus casei]SJM61935.1 hypothetical protein CZ674_08065 [Agrococcus casei LMG 22410]
MSEQQIFILAITLILCVTVAITTSTSSKKTNELYRVRMARRAARKRIAERKRASTA